MRKFTTNSTSINPFSLATFNLFSNFELFCLEKVDGFIVKNFEAFDLRLHRANNCVLSHTHNMYVQCAVMHIVQDITTNAKIQNVLDF